VQPCTRSEDGCGWWAGFGRAHRLQVSKGPPLRGQPRCGRGDGSPASVLGFRVDCRSRRAVSGVRGLGAVVAVLAPRALAERLRPIGETAPWLVRQRAGGSAFGCSSSKEGAPRPGRSRSPFTRWAGRTGVGSSVAGCRCKAGLPRRNQERQRLVGRSPLRKRTPERRTMRGSKRVKRRESRHPPAFGFHRAQGIEAKSGY